MVKEVFLNLGAKLTSNFLALESIDAKLGKLILLASIGKQKRFRMTISEGKFS